MERAALAVARETTVEIVVPVFNESRDLERGVRRLRAHLDAGFPFRTTVTIAGKARSAVQLQGRPPALDALLGVWRLIPGERSRFARFAMVGVTSTIAYIIIYLVLQEAGPAWFANAVALGSTSVLSMAVNRRFTFGIRGRGGMARDYVAGLAAFALALLTTSLAGEALHVLAPRANDLLDVGVLTAANVTATAFRYTLLSASMTRHLQSTASLHADV